jgi:hypothetical protein
MRDSRILKDTINHIMTITNGNKNKDEYIAAKSGSKLLRGSSCSMLTLLDRVSKHCIKRPKLLD